MKISKLVLLVLAGSIAGTAAAQAFSSDGGRGVKFAVGEGVLRNRDDVQAKFAFAVRMVGDHAARGHFRLATHVPHARVNIASDHINRLRVYRNQAWFAGPAVLEVRTADGMHRLEGTLVVHVRDNVRIWDGRHRRVFDTLELRFQAARSDRTFTYAGIAEHDSIRVGRRGRD